MTLRVAQFSLTKSTFVFFDGFAWTPPLRSPSPIMAPAKTQAEPLVAWQIHLSPFEARQSISTYASNWLNHHVAKTQGGGPIMSYLDGLSVQKGVFAFDILV